MINRGQHLPTSSDVKLWPKGFVLICICCATMTAEAKTNNTTPLQDTQIVLYKPPVLLKEFNEKFRTFEIGGRPWKIRQDWYQEGVAGVVWEAVSRLHWIIETIKEKCFGFKECLLTWHDMATPFLCSIGHSSV